MLLDDYVTSCIETSDLKTERSLSLSTDLKSAILGAIKCTIDTRREHGFSINRKHNKKSCLEAGELCSGTENSLRVVSDYAVGIDSPIFSEPKHIGQFHTHPGVSRGYGPFSPTDNETPWSRDKKNLLTDHPLYIDMVWSQRELILYLIILRGKAKYQTLSPSSYLRLIDKEANESGDVVSPYYRYSFLPNNVYMIHKMTASASFFASTHRGAYFRAYKQHVISSNYDFYMASVTGSTDPGVHNRFDEFFLVVPPAYA